MADLALERNQAEEAESFIARSAARCLSLALDGDGDDDELAEDDHEWDFELMANLHRARADACWLRGEWLKAAPDYGRAVANAYWFQGNPHDPDECTQRFYLEMTSRAAERVLTLAQAYGHDLALRFATEVQALLPGTPASSDSAGLADAV